MINEKERLVQLYGSLKALRQKGVKMKDIAAKCGLSPSVLSALYATVLPSFCDHLEDLGFEQALDNALSNVNNLSRKKLQDIEEHLYDCVVGFQGEQTAAFRQEIHPFLHFLDEATSESFDKLGNLSGMYMSYSCSSSVRALKAEPLFEGTLSGTGL